MPTVRVPLTQGKYALLDEEDLPLIAPYKWHAQRDQHKHGPVWYAATFLSGQRKATRMHRLLLGFPASDIDHRNGDGLDNRRANLRTATRSQNCANKIVRSSHGFRGVFWDQANRGWRAEVMKDGKRVFSRRSPDIEKAARAYDEAARKYHGEFAVLNFPEKGERGTDGVIR